MCMKFISNKIYFILYCKCIYSSQYNKFVMETLLIRAQKYFYDENILKIYEKSIFINTY